ncbi:hypothetical protein DOY81_005808 [Sarcophaga bullata]|nr:hypothetical protein DOY81_005808 [Sarcophaga bullata]
MPKKKNNKQTTTTKSNLLTTYYHHHKRERKKRDKQAVLQKMSFNKKIKIDFFLCKMNGAIMIV